MAGLSIFLTMTGCALAAALCIWVALQYQAQRTARASEPYRWHERRMVGFYLFTGASCFTLMAFALMSYFGVELR